MVKVEFGMRSLARKIEAKSFVLAAYTGDAKQIAALCSLQLLKLGVS